MKSNKKVDHQRPVVIQLDTIQKVWLLLVWMALFVPGLSLSARAQITGSNGTSVSTSGNTIDIKDGQPGGNNLFHTFGQFNVNTGQTANFVTTPNIVNVLSRINGGSPSVIDGKIQVSGSNANLFLMNPAGMVFGAGASLNVPGSFTATTANAIEFGNGNWFNAFDGVTPNNYSALIGNPTGLGFASGVQPGSIFNAANLTTTPGKSITLVGGTVISTGTIKTEGGNITIATVPEGTFVRLSNEGNPLSLDLPMAAAGQINANPASFTPLSLPELLTSSDAVKAIAANNVTVDSTGVVRLVSGPDLKIAQGDTVTKANRIISQGDVITKTLDASIPGTALNYNNPSNPPLGDVSNPFTPNNPAKNAGSITVESSQAVLSGNIDTKNNNSNFVLNQPGSGGNGGNISLRAATEIKTGNITSSSNNNTDLADTQTVKISPSSGNVTLATRKGDIVVDSISANEKSVSSGSNGGNINVQAAGLFRALKYILNGYTPGSTDYLSLFTNNSGKIKIEHSGNNFTVGATAVESNPGSPFDFRGQPAQPGFVFANGASGSLGVIATSANLPDVYVPGGNSPASITISALPPISNPNQPITISPSPDTIPAREQIVGEDGTIVNVAGDTFNITGGNRSGVNLFHSFDKFNLLRTPTSIPTANFDLAGTSGVKNVLGRVTGGTPSIIDGKIQVSGGIANLFLINPAGMVFGQNASLNVPGAFTATTANAIGFSDGKWFNAFGTNNYAQLTDTPANLAFSSGYQPGSIFSAANFDDRNVDTAGNPRNPTVRSGQNITLVGGTVVNTGTIKTEGGNITIATVPDGKLVSLSNDGKPLSGDLSQTSIGQINSSPSEPLTLPELLTSSDVAKRIAANNLTVDSNGVVRLVTGPDLKIAKGDTVTKANRQISNGDVITKNIDTSIPNPPSIPFDPNNPNPLGSFDNPHTPQNPAKNGGDIRIESNNAILTGTLDTSNKLNVFVRNEKGSGGNGGNITLAAKTEIKTGKIDSSTGSLNRAVFLSDPLNPNSPERRPTEAEIAAIQPRGGNVSISTKTGDAIVDSISTNAGSGFVGDTRYPHRGGDLTVNAAGRFRVVDFVGFSNTLSVSTAPFGNINITHGGTDFVIGASVVKRQFDEGFIS
ncbi:filamentous hemagglutinin N-terminal domain-containing protein, partial [Chamaesiphon sp. VAR_48_metabat_135_sub]|uniref:two-partner secretion domain-containing protein n=1 Tax=Chamaesiphon sp. VAR_48_metabat_135_sub TaxID=2964699 RepID=UPI00286C1555